MIWQLSSNVLVDFLRPALFAYLGKSPAYCAQVTKTTRVRRRDLPDPLAVGVPPGGICPPSPPLPFPKTSPCWGTATAPLSSPSLRQPRAAREARGGGEKVRAVARPPPRGRRAD